MTRGISYMPAPLDGRDYDGAIQSIDAALATLAAAAKKMRQIAFYPLAFVCGGHI